MAVPFDSVEDYLLMQRSTPVCSNNEMVNVDGPSLRRIRTILTTNVGHGTISTEEKS